MKIEQSFMKYTGVSKGNYLLIVINAKGNWVKVRVLNDTPRYLKSIELFDKMYVTH